MINKENMVNIGKNIRVPYWLDLALWYRKEDFEVKRRAIVNRPILKNLGLGSLTNRTINDLVSYYGFEPLFSALDTMHDRKSNNPDYKVSLLDFYRLVDDYHKLENRIESSSNCGEVYGKFIKGRLEIIDTSSPNLTQILFGDLNTVPYKKWEDATRFGKFLLKATEGISSKLEISFQSIWMVGENTKFTYVHTNQNTMH